MLTSRRRRRQDRARLASAEAPRPVTIYGRADTLVALGLGTASFFLYALTAARDIVVGDTPELAAAALTLGVAHPPGYPLLTLLGHVFGTIMPGPLPFRVNLVAVVSGAGTVVLVYLIAVRLTRERLWSALAAGLLAVTPLFWSWSLVFEAFSLNNLLAAGIVFLLVRWHEEPDTPGWLIGAAFLGGLALANHQSIVLLGPAVLYVLWTRRSYFVQSRRLLPACGVAFLLGLLPYAYLPWAAAREPYWNWMGVSSVGDFVALVTRQHYGTGRLINVPEMAGGSAVARMGAHLASFGPLQGALLVLGAVGAFLSVRWYFWFAVLAFVVAGPVFAAYANANLDADYVPWILERFFLLSHVLVAPVVACGLALLAHLIRELGTLASFQLPRRVIAGAVAVPVLAFSGAQSALSYREVDQSTNQVARIFAEDILASLEPGAVLIASGDEVVHPLVYLQAVEGHRLDVDLLVGPLLAYPWYVRQLRARHPDVTVPFERIRLDGGRMKDLVDANQGRRIYAIGGLLDRESLRDSYTSSARGLAFRLERVGRMPPVELRAAENESIVDRYTPPPPAEIDPRTFERAILNHYTAAAQLVGELFEAADQPGAARRWYGRALAIDPEWRRARESLDRLGR